MSAFQMTTTGLLVGILGRSYVIGHDIRNDWTSFERSACLVLIVGGFVLVGMGLSRLAGISS